MHLVKMSKTATDLAQCKTLYDYLAPLELEVLKEFVHRCADELCRRKGPSFERFCSACSWTQSQLRQTTSLMEKFLIDCVINNHSRAKIGEILPLNENQINGLLSCIDVRIDELQQVLLDDIQNGAAEVLRDFDWKLKWVMGSSSLSSHQETLLELDLNTIKNSNSDILKKSASTCSTIKVELTRENVNTLISALEKARSEERRVGKECQP